MPLRERLGHAVAGFGQNLVYNVLALFLLVYLYEDLRLSSRGIAILTVVLTVVRVWDAVNDVVIGVLIDRTRTRWGTFRPYPLIADLRDVLRRARARERVHHNPDRVPLRAAMGHVISNRPLHRGLGSIVLGFGTTIFSIGGAVIAHRLRRRQRLHSARRSPHRRHHRRALPLPGTAETDEPPHCADRCESRCRNSVRGALRRRL